MSTYFIGDVHGCLDELKIMLDRINYDEAQDRLLFTGDLVGRGPEPVQVIKLVQSLKNAKLVLGNHDLHLISLFCGGYPLERNPDPSLMQVLKSPAAFEMIDWLIKQPLIIKGDLERVASESTYSSTGESTDKPLNKPANKDRQTYALVHAGIPHHWTLDEARQLAQEVKDNLVARWQEHVKLYKLGSASCDVSSMPSMSDIHKIPKWRETAMGEFTHNLYGNRPFKLPDKDHSSDSGDPKSISSSSNISGIERIRFILNVFTRMRMCRADGSQDFSYNLDPADYIESSTRDGEIDNRHRPWFEHYADEPDYLIVFGHWAAIRGKSNKEKIWAMDRGCAWGRELACRRLEDGKMFLVPAATEWKLAGD